MQNSEDAKPGRFSLAKRIQIRLIAAVGWLAIWVLGSTIRFRFENREALERHRREGIPFIASFWHNQILLATYFFRFNDIVVITSQHFDGEYIARIITRFGYRAARGSSSRGAVRVLIQLKKQADQGRELAFPVDGPRGPLHKVKPGPVWLAQKTGLPILCFSVQPGQFWALRSWDRFKIPKPFSRALVRFGTPLYFSPEADPDECLAIYQREMERLQAYAESSVAREA